jgi:hypothetical protein
LVIGDDDEPIGKVYALHVPLVISLDQVGQGRRCICREDQGGRAEEDRDENDCGQLSALF